MSGSIFIFTREVTGDAGEQFKQVVTVYGQSLSSAQNVLGRELAEIRTHSRGAERAYLPDPPWRATEVALDKEKVITSAVSQ